MAAEVMKPPRPGTIRIIDRTKIPSPEPGRIGKFDEIITYQDEAMRTYVITIPSEELQDKPEEEQIKIIGEWIKRQIQERQRWAMREIPI